MPDGSSATVYQANVPGTTATPPNGTLQQGVEYRWKVRARNHLGAGPYSNNNHGVEFFLGCVVDAPVLLAPLTCPTAMPTVFSWGSVSRATGYVVRITNHRTNATAEFQTVGSSMAVTPGMLARQVDYSWVVAGRTGDHLGPFSLPQSFCVEPVPMAKKPDMRANACDRVPGPPAAVGHPVSVSSGNMYLDQVDITVPGIGPALAFTRSYNSENRERESLLGPGWTNPFEQHVVLGASPNSSEEIILNLSDGTALYFWDRGRDGTYEAYVPAAEESSFTREADGTFVRRFRQGGSETYDPHGRIVKITDRLNLSLTIERATHPDGRILGVTNASGRTIGFAYYSGTRLKKVGGPGDLVTAEFTYDGANRLHKVTYRDGSGYTFEYDGGNRLTTVTDHSGRIVETHAYYPDGRAETSSLADGRERLTLRYETNRTIVTDALGKETTYEFQEFNRTRRVVKITGPCNSCGGSGNDVQEWGYDEAGRVTHHIRAPGKWTRYVYHPTTGDLTRVRDALLNNTIYTYYPDGRVKSITTPDNATKTFTYGVAGPETITESIGATRSRRTRIEYDAATGQVVKTIDARGKVTTYEYRDGTRDLWKVRGPLHPAPARPSARFEYDVMGRLKTAWDALDRPTITEYDASGRVKWVQYPDNTKTEFTYDRAGRRTTAKDARGRESWTIYDPYGRVEAMRDPAGNLTRQDYDLMSRLTSVTDALGRTTRFEYDGYGRLTRTVYPGGGSESRTYNAAGQLVSTMDRKGVVTSYAYDGLDRLVRKTFSDGSPAVTFEYDVMGRMTNVAQGSETLTWTYDLLGRMLTETSVRHASTLAYEYDDAGNRLTVKLNGTTVASYAYDDAARPQFIRHEGLEFELVHDLASQRDSLEFPNGVISTYRFSNMGRLTHLEAERDTSVIAGADYQYDLVGNRTRKVLADHAESYTYDELSRLTRVTRDAGSEWAFSYDKVGNRTGELKGRTWLTAGFDDRNQLVSKQGGGGSIAVEGSLSERGSVQVAGQPARMLPDNRFAGAFTPLAGTNEVAVQATDDSGNSVTKRYRLDLSGGPLSYEHDANGNLIRKTEGPVTWRYEWTVENQLRRVTRDDVEVARFVYDPLGRRIEKVAGGVTYTWLYDGQDILRETVTNSAGSSTYLYLHGPGVDEPLARKDTATGAMTYYHADGLGSIVATTDAAGNVTSRRQYDVWGNLEVGATENGYAFTGREWDSETGLYYYRARYYDPKAGRFISEDPIQLGGDGPNFYAYVLNQPANRVDPSGEMSILDMLTYGYVLLTGVGNSILPEPMPEEQLRAQNAFVVATSFQIQRSLVSQGGEMPMVGCGVGGLGLRSVSFPGLAQNMPLRALTHQEIFRSFKDTGWTPSNHAISRLKDPRITPLGVRTLNDVRGILNNGTVTDAGGGLKSIARGRVEIIYNPETNVIVTITPR